MPAPLKLDIPQPCHEKWSEMSPQPGGGRHCASCDRVLTDFTGFTDRELVTFFERNEQKICGRFSPGQLGRRLYAEPLKSGWGRWVAVAAGMGAFSLQATALPTALMPSPTLQQPADTLPGRPLPPPPPGPIVGEIVGISDAAEMDSIQVYGQIIDEDGTPIIGATVHRLGDQTGTVTDIEGRYTLRVPLLTTLQVSYLGYEPAYIEVREIWLQQDRSDVLKLITNVMAEPSMLTGEVAIAGYIIAERPQTFFGKLRQTFRRWQTRWHDRRQVQEAENCEKPLDPPARPPVTLVEIPDAHSTTELSRIAVSPNPFGDDLQLTFPATTPADLMLSLFDATGRALRFEPWLVGVGSNTHTLQLEGLQLPTGTYFLRIEDSLGNYFTHTLVRE